MSTALLDLQVQQELDRRECQADPAAFVQRHCTIEEPNGTVLPFRLWPCQAEALTALQQEEAVIVLKARRLGLSWVVLAFALWLAIFQQGIRILILCKKESDATELLSRIRRMRDRIAADRLSAHILGGLQSPGKVRDAVTTLDVGASTIKALVGTPDAARSETAGLVILDEFAFQRGASEIWQAALPTSEGGGKVVAVSTGNGGEKSSRLGAEFAKQWSRARRGLSNFRPLFFPWQARPGRDQAWKAAALANFGDPTKFRIEYPETEADAFLVADADLIYPGPHMDAVERLGTELQPTPHADLWLGIDWGVNTHFALAHRTPGGGLAVIAEVWSTNADLERDADRLAELLDGLDADPRFLRYDPGAAGAKVIGTFVGLMRQRRPGFRPRVRKIPFARFKVVAIKYVQLLARRAHDGQALRVLAVSPTGAPEILRQMRAAEWRDPDVGRTEKGDDHGADAVLTLAAELGYEMFGRDRDVDAQAA